MLWRLLWYGGYYSESVEVTMSIARPAVEEQEVTMSMEVTVVRVWRLL